MTYKDFKDALRAWAEEEPRIDAAITIGSYVRGTQKPDSDIDAVIVSSDKLYFIENTAVLKRFGSYSRYQLEDWTACTSVRVWFDDGMEVEFGFVRDFWATNVAESGAARALEDGFETIYDPNGWFTAYQKDKK